MSNNCEEHQHDWFKPEDTDIIVWGNFRYCRICGLIADPESNDIRLPEERYLLMSDFIERREDMSPRGHIRIGYDGDGDICIGILSSSNGGEILDQWADVEFCTIGSGGGHSPHTYKALQELMKAIERDNEEYPAGRTENYVDDQAL